MKEESIGSMKKFPKNLNKGMSTLEILLAFVILILAITAVIGIGFGNQSITVDAETNTEALSKAQQLLEDARADSRKDFFSVNSKNISDQSGSLSYAKSLLITDLTPCKKLASSTVSWNLSPTRQLKIDLGTFLTDIPGVMALGGDCDTEPITEWDNPKTASSIGLGGSGGTDIDVQDSIIYLSSSPSAPAKEDLYIYKFNEVGNSLTFLSKKNISNGISSLDASGDYIYLANNETSKQLVIIDSNNPNSPQIIASSTLPGMTTGKGKSIYYFDHKVYIGTQYLPCASCAPTQNNEFHIYDVSTPNSPQWKGSFNVNNNVNDIVVRGNYAYLATSGDDREIVILNVSNPANISQIGIYNAQDVPSGVGEDATSLFLLGNKLFFGRERAAGTRPDFYVLDISNPATPQYVGSRNLGMSPGGGPTTPRVVGIAVRGTLAFIGMDDPNFGFKLVDLVYPSLPYHTTCTSLNISENSTGLDMENDHLFITSASNDEIRVIEDQTSVCPST